MRNLYLRRRRRSRFLWCRYIDKQKQKQKIKIGNILSSSSSTYCRSWCFFFFFFLASNAGPMETKKRKSVSSGARKEMIDWPRGPAVTDRKWTPSNRSTSIPGHGEITWNWLRQSIQTRINIKIIRGTKNRIIWMDMDVAYILHNNLHSPQKKERKKKRAGLDWKLCGSNR